jgi:osmotically-inducible protein OsmY
MKTDSEIKRDVEAELRWDPQIDQTDIAVKVNQGVATLTGFTASYVEKYRAEEATQRVAGVAGVANDIAVRLRSGEGLSDPQIARAAVAALQTALPTICSAIKPIVHEGSVTLEGEVDWQYQRERAESAVREVHGVLRVRNAIVIKPHVAVAEIKHSIEEAFRRNAEVDANRITVDAQGNEITLRGEVRSFAERDEAQRTAWSAPGVVQVKNELTVRT